MQNQTNDLTTAFDQAETIATVGSPSTTTEVKVDVSASAADNKLVGEMIVMKYRQQGEDHYALGQITEVELRNRMLEDHTIQTIARHRGVVDHVSDLQDTHDGKVSINAVFRETASGIEQSTLATVPPTGTRIKTANDPVVDRLTEQQRDRLVYLGNSYQSTLALPMWFRQFNGAPGQLSEAHHLGIFGQSGSGKSTLAKMILLAYASHPEMAILIIDPMGEFSKSLEGRPEDFELQSRDRMVAFGRQITNINVSTITLGRWDLVEEFIKESRIIRTLNITNSGASRAKDEAALVIRQHLENRTGQNTGLVSLSTRGAFDAGWNALHDAFLNNHIYATTNSNRQREQQMAAFAPEQLDALYRDHWQPIMELFNHQRPGGNDTSRTIRDLLEVPLIPNPGSRPIVNINLDLGASQYGNTVWNERTRNIAINQILGDVERYAEAAYREDRSLNTLVVIDEAHRLAPSTRQDDDYGERIRNRLSDAALTTRKYGLGWLFISQSLANVNPNIVRQTRIRFFGYGMAIGSELERLHEIAGGNRRNIDLYQSFPDPESAISRESRSYSFMVTGPVSPLCSTSHPLFLSVYNNAQAFIEKNVRLFPRTQPPIA